MVALKDCMAIHIADVTTLIEIKKRINASNVLLVVVGLAVLDTAYIFV